MDTIFAEATAPGKAGVAVIRISGPAALEAGRSLVGPLPDFHRASLRMIRSLDGSTLDHGLVLAFPAGASFTGEDVVELQIHGSRAVVSAILHTLEDLPALRQAAPGEFTRRALDNERLDLTQVEGLADLIEAETELQRLQAQRVLSGEISAKVLEWRRKLIEAAALIEATLDFADEEVPVDVFPDVLDLIDQVRSDLLVQISGYGASERIRDGFQVAIMGPPNAGKSTLMNAIARREVALTSSIAGTTRDVIEVRVDIQGIPVTFLDTAGLRETEDPLEAAGISLARRRARDADLRIFLATKDTEIFDDLSGDDFVLKGKADIADGVVSGKTGQGVDQMIARIAYILRAKTATPSVAIRERHATAMRDAVSCLSEATDGVNQERDSEIVAESLRSAVKSLEELIGRVDTDDLLGDIFSRFCIGK
ncbi:tRNA uridine-5-carboxymethylaminomethyl(34) synthesis GTPase MnmE [Maribius pontilimi]|uniref:tRNA modification GTPase MnmE n=1 Tax=Palleronia pontilimi TaxID=1964209 RepID=A0A934IF14_9RHOB|nr:tRNA uridine-5-carboxymethylaminomethyl(34) synthesis GTPase MnmE [Palleronia pontilimi]MBJ3761546.1 tRNA uridine-5-carboxymethylaminomethyl(34) synthesis GTPase MnmE [Palleronia pontilimi]